MALDYEIKQENYGVSWNTLVSVPTYTNYRIFFTFKIRNGNCMVFPFDSATGSELTNESFTDNGFYLDLANSRYLDINVQRSVYVEGTNGYTEDIRFNRPASDGTNYTEEGIYTITVKNIYTSQETIKTIYVGTDPAMRAFVVSGYSLEDIKEMVDEGYEISDDGTMIPPIIEEADESEIIVEENEDEEMDSPQRASEDDSSSRSEDDRDSKHHEKGKGASVVVVLLLIGVAAGAVAFFVLKKNNQKAKINSQDNVSEQQTDSIAQVDQQAESENSNKDKSNEN